MLNKGKIGGDGTFVPFRRKRLEGAPDIDC